MSLVVRLATAEDYKAVLDINGNVYDGFDYLAYSYFPFLGDPHYLPLVGELDGRVVSFSCLELLDQGNVALSCAGRVQEDVQRKGIMPEHTRQQMIILKKQWPNVKIYSYTAVFTDFHVHRMARRSDVQLNRMWNYIGFEFNTSNINRSLKQLEPMSSSMMPRRLSIQSLLHHLSTKEAKQRVFGYEPWFVSRSYWCPLPVSDHNIRHAALQNAFQATIVDNQITAISFFPILKQPHEARFDIWFYGSSVETLLCHIHSVLLHVQQTIPDQTVRLVLSFPKQLDREQVLHALEPNFGAQRRDPPFHKDQSAAFSYPLSKL